MLSILITQLTLVSPLYIWEVSAENWDIDPEQTFSIALYFSLCPHCNVQTSKLHPHTHLFYFIINQTKGPSPSVCKIHSCGAGVWQKLRYNLFLVSSDSKHHQHHCRERWPQHQNDSVSAGGLDHRLPRRHQRNRLLWEGSREDGCHDESKIWRTPLVSLSWMHVVTFSLSQVMYFSSLFPYVVLFCFLVRGLMLKGSVDGIAHMFTPKVKLTQLLCPSISNWPYSIIKS